MPSQDPIDSPRRRLLVRGAVGVVITVGFFALLWRFFDWDQLVDLLEQRKPLWLLAAAGIYLTLYAVRAFRFQLMAPRTPYGTMFCITCVHNFLLRLLPMRTGDLSYAFLVKRAGTADLSEGVISLILIRLFDAGMVVVLFGVTLALNRGVYRGDPTPGFIAAGVMLVIGILSVVFFRQLLGLSVRMVGGLARLLRLDGRPKVGKLIGRLEEAISSFVNTPASLLLWVTATTAVQWLLNFAIIFAVMRGLSVQVSIAQAVLGGTAAVVSSFLPIGGIGSFGALEAGWALGFKLVGLQTSVAVASALGFSMVTLIFAAVFGLLGWIGLTIVRREPK